MPPIVSVVGKSKSGKTTLIEKLIGELKGRGYRVATIKHAPKAILFEESDKDNWRHIKAGSEFTAVAAPGKVVLVKPVAGEVTLDEIVYLFDEDYDIILAEGFKEGSAPKIEVHRQAIGAPLENLSKLMAIVTDEPLKTKTRQFSPEDIKGLADLLEKGYIEPQSERTTLYINNKPIPLSTFPKDFFTATLLAMVSCLKGVGEVGSLKALVRKKPGRS